MMLIIRLLAVFGVLAILLRVGRSLFSLMRGGVDMFLARDLHEVRAQRGDLTGMQEANDLRRVGRHRRAVAAARLSFWIGLLIVPAVTPWPAYLCAAYCVIWLLPRPAGSSSLRGSIRVNRL